MKISHVLDRWLKSDFVKNEDENLQLYYIYLKSAKIGLSSDIKFMFIDSID